MKTAILGISFSSRMFGLAVVHPGTLINYHMQYFKESWSPAKMKRILTSLTSAVNDYNITHMVLSIPPIYLHAEHFNELWMEIVGLGKEKGIKVVSFKRDALQAICGSDERMTRRLLMQSLLSRYPELEPYYKRERRNRNKYYHKMFEAVAAATLLTEQEGL